MLKYAMLLVLMYCAGCQTTQPESSPQVMQDGSPRSEKLSIRLDEYVSNYDVQVQRAMLMPTAAEGRDRWNVISAPKVSGYAGKWRSSDAVIDPASYAAKASYLLGGEMISISLEPGVHLVAKVMPDKQNTARVLGIFSESKVTPLGMEVISVPFDVYCTLGVLVEFYHEEIDVTSVLNSAGN